MVCGCGLCDNCNARAGAKSALEAADSDDDAEIDGAGDSIRQSVVEMATVQSSSDAACE
jgi:hypothetical protein